MNLPAGLALRLFRFNNVASDATEVGVAKAADLAGAAHLMLVDGSPAPGPRACGVRGHAGGVDEAAAGPFPEVGRDDQAATVAGPPVRRVLQPVPVAVAAGGGRGVHRPPAGEDADVHGVERPQLPEPLRMFCEFITDRATAGCPSARTASARCRSRSCTSGTPSPTSASTRATRVAGR